MFVCICLCVHVQEYIRWNIPCPAHPEVKVHQYRQHVALHVPEQVLEKTRAPPPPKVKVYQYSITCSEVSAGEDSCPTPLRSKSTSTASHVPEQVLEKTTTEQVSQHRNNPGLQKTCYFWSSGKTCHHHTHHAHKGLFRAFHDL